MKTAGTTETSTKTDSGTTFTASPPIASPASNGLGFWLSVGTKGWIVFSAVIAYSVCVGLFAFHQKTNLLHDFEEMQAALESETILAQAHVSIFHAIGAISININDSDAEVGMQRIQMHQQLFLARQAAVTERFPVGVLNAGRVKAAFEAANENPSQVNLNRLIAELIESEGDLEMLTGRERENRKSLSDRYRAQTDSAAKTVFLLGSLGLLLLGATIGLFFRRLADDLRILQSAALETVRGLRGRPISVTRHDEVGQLMMAVNSMADTLDKHEKELMLERQKYFHQEKMAAIGVLAAGISHEIGNPIAAISGIAQEMIERRGSGRPVWATQGCDGCQPELIHEQAIRLAAITREISEFSSPGTPEPQLVDLNAQLRSTASLIRYDKRLDDVTLSFELDSQLPAIYGVANQLTQLIMNLLINAMDALESAQDRTPTIAINTGSDAERAWVIISDNGCGISEPTLGRIFEAFFTTKPAGKGTGLGLSLCYSIVKTHGGTIEIDSTLGIGTRVHVFFPLNNTLHTEAPHI